MLRQYMDKVASHISRGLFLSAVRAHRVPDPHVGAIKSSPIAQGWVLLQLVEGKREEERMRGRGGGKVSWGGGGARTAPLDRRLLCWGKV